VVSLFITLAGILLKLDEITVLYLFMGDVFIIGGISIIQFIVKTVKVTNQKKQEQDNNNI
jgi:cyanate permease